MLDVERQPMIVWDLPPFDRSTVSGLADELVASAGNAPTEFLVTADLAPGFGSLPGPVDTAKLEAAARSLGFEQVASVPLTATREARLWQREVPPA
jgi:hypothetical protein